MDKEKIKPYTPEEDPRLEFSKVETVGFSKKETKNVLSHIESELSIMNKKMKGLPSKVKIKKVIIHNLKSVPGTDFAGLAHKDGVIELAGDTLKHSKKPTPILNLGKWGVSGEGDAIDVLGILRHEVGHQVGYSELLISEIKFKKFFNKMGDKTWWDYWTDISHMSKTNHREAFAESFSVFTSPKYKAGMLPKELEEIFKKG